jgi:cytochrome c peroxidase
MEDAKEHGGNRAMYAHVIYKDKNYKKEYENLFGKMPNLSNTKKFPGSAGPTKDRHASQAWKSMQPEDRKAITQIYVNMGKAIAAYEHKLRPAPAKFDHFAKAVINKDAVAMQKAMSNDEAAGLKLFISKANCIICHNGPAFRDFEFHNVGAPQTMVNNRYDFGRKTATSKVKRSPFNCFGEYNDSADKSCDELTYIVFDEHTTLGAFKTPSLRNISKTAPYMHAGQYKTLADVINHYIDPPPIKLGENDTRMMTFDLDDTEQHQLEQFLKALDSDIDADAHWLATP